MVARSIENPAYEAEAHPDDTHATIAEVPPGLDNGGAYTFSAADYHDSVSAHWQHHWHSTHLALQPTLN